MKKNVCLTATLRQPFRSLLLLILFGLITFGFITKTVEYILVHRETGVLGSYYRSIGVLENIEDPQSRDISAGIDLIQNSRYIAYNDQRELVSGVLSDYFSTYWGYCNCTLIKEVYPELVLPDMTDFWFIGELSEKFEVTTRVNRETVGYYFRFSVDTVLAAPPDYIPGDLVHLFFMFEGNESDIPLIDEMEIGGRYIIRGWQDTYNATDSMGSIEPLGPYYRLKPLDDGNLWYIPLDEGESIDFNTPELAPIKNSIDILNENLHTLAIITTEDMSAIPEMQEASRKYYLTAGRWLNYQDNQDGSKFIVVPEQLTTELGLELGDELQFSSRPLQDAFAGFIREGVDSQNWRSYPTYQDTYTIVGIYNGVEFEPVYAYIPANSLRPGFTSTHDNELESGIDYSFVLKSSRLEDKFIEKYNDKLLELGISLTFLENNGETYWASVDPIRHSLLADLLIFGLLMAAALILAVFLYGMQRKRDYAILRALGVPAKRANAQLALPLLFLGGLGITAGGLSAWNHALEQAAATLSTIPTPGGVYPSAELSSLYFAGLCAAVFLLLALFTWLGVTFLVHKSVFALLQGGTFQLKEEQKPSQTPTLSQPRPSMTSNQIGVAERDEHPQPKAAAAKEYQAAEIKYDPSYLRQFVLHHVQRSRLKSILTLAIALGFVLAAGWIQQTIARSRLEVERLWDTTIVEADILKVDSSFGSSTLDNGFVYKDTINEVLDSGFVKKAVLEADTVWFSIKGGNSQVNYSELISVYAFDSPEAFYSGLENPDSVQFMPGWDMALFTKAWTLDEIRNEGLPAIFPASLLEDLQINVGETVRIVDQFHTTFICVIVGQYSGWFENTFEGDKILWPYPYVLIPLSVLESTGENHIKYTVAHFELDPAMNRDLSTVQAYVEEVLEIYDGQLRYVIWDEELRLVVSQLENQVTLLEALYPVVIAVSVLVGAGLCFLLLQQTVREAATLRVLGVTRTDVRLALLGETFGLSLIGIVIGLLISCILFLPSGLVPVGSLVTGAGLYLAGALVGSVTGAIQVTNKMPLELLQVKE